MTTPTREHRAEARGLLGDTWSVDVYAVALVDDWLESGAWLRIAHGSEFAIAQHQLSRIAQALADRDARIGELEAAIIAVHNEATKVRAYLDQVREIPPGAIVVELGDSTTRSELESLSYIDDEGDRVRPFVGRLDQLGNLDIPYSMTLMLEPEVK